MPHRVTHDLDDPAFPHHTERGYFRKCRRECCLAAHRAARKRREMLGERGVSLTVDAEPVREHVRRLIAEVPMPGTVGRHRTTGAIAVARAAGVSQKTVHDLLTETVRMRRVNAERLLRVTAEQVAAQTGYVPAKRPRQQIGSLMALGWPGPYLSERLGHAVTGTGPPQFMYDRTAWMRRDVAERIAALAEEIGDRKGPSPVTAQRARKRGWYAPGAYDEDGTLIPGAARTEAYERAGRGEAEERRESKAEMRQAIVDAGYWQSAETLAERFGITSRTVQRIRAQAGMVAPESTTSDAVRRGLAARAERQQQHAA